MSAKPQIFLDTTVLHSDPFLEGNFNNLLIHFANGGGVTIHLSSVVLAEARFHYQKSIKEIAERFNKVNWDLNRYWPKKYTFEILSAEECLKAFDEFYAGHFESGLINLVDYSNDLLPELVSRSIERKKPFSEKKVEFRDGIIWLSYVNYILNNELSNVFLITGNTSDYLNEEKTDLHPDLKADLNSVKVYTSVKDLITSEPALVNMQIQADFESWLMHQGINEDTIIETIHEKFHDRLSSSMEDVMNKLNVSHYYPEVQDGRFEPSFPEVVRVKKYKLNIVRDVAILTAEITIRINTLLIRFDEDGTESVVGEKTINFASDISYTLHQKDGPENFEIDHIRPMNWKK